MLAYASGGLANPTPIPITFRSKIFYSRWTGCWKPCMYLIPAFKVVAATGDTLLTVLHDVSDRNSTLSNTEYWQAHPDIVAAVHSLMASEEQKLKIFLVKEWVLEKKTAENTIRLTADEKDCMDKCVGVGGIRKSLAQEVWIVLSQSEESFGHCSARTQGARAWRRNRETWVQYATIQTGKAMECEGYSPGEMGVKDRRRHVLGSESGAEGYLLLPVSSRTPFLASWDREN
ncbi:hypothetical protein BDZ97DRAFT_1759595 [Flammula alnicola]|nr:hypothetical protein BDZ97DRAFT_1759595 [Flammula alnicola]